MAKNDNLSDFFTEIIEVIHNKGVTQKIYPYQIPDAIRKCKDSSYEILEDDSKMFPPIEDLLQDIANILKNILGISGEINAQDYASVISGIASSYTLTFTNACEGMYLSVNGTRYTDNAVIDVSADDYIAVGAIDTSNAYNASLFQACNIDVDGGLLANGGEYTEYELGEYRESGGALQVETTYVQTYTSFYVEGDCSITLTPKEKNTVTINYPTGCPDSLRIYAHTAADPKYSDWHIFVDTVNNNSYGSGSSSYAFNSDDNFITILSNAYWQPVDSIIDSIYGLDLVYIRAHVDSGNGEIQDIMDILLMLSFMFI